MNTKKIYVISAIVFVIIAGVLFFAPKQKNTSDKTIFKIGVIAPMSGDNAQMGKNCTQAIEFAMLNIDNNLVQYKMIVEDNLFQSARSAVAAHKLISNDKVNVIITCDALAGSSVAPITAQSNTLLIATNASADEIATQNKLTFLHWPLPEQEAKRISEVMSDDGVSKIVIFEQNHPAAIALSKAIQENIKNSKVISIMPSERNFNDISEFAVNEKADAYMFITLPPTVNILMRRLNEKDKTTKRYSIEIPSFVEDKSIFEGTKYVDVYEGDTNVMDRYQVRYKTNNIHSVAHAYDSVMIINRLVPDHLNTTGKIPTGSEMEGALLNLKDYKGIVGNIEVDAHGRIASDVVVRKIENGKIINIR